MKTNESVLVDIGLGRVRCDTESHDDSVARLDHVFQCRQLPVDLSCHSLLGIYRCYFSAGKAELFDMICKLNVHCRQDLFCLGDCPMTLLFPVCSGDANLSSVI